MNQLGLVKNIVEDAGMGISYAYEDLVFLDHNSLILQFTDNDREVMVHINDEADGATVNRDIANLQEVALSHDMSFAPKGHKLRLSRQAAQLSFISGDVYVLSEDDDEKTIRLEFSKDAVDH
jgi:hypothetical protein